MNKSKLRCKILKLRNDNSYKKLKLYPEKIDELNQETDTLLDEIDKWQM